MTTSTFYADTSDGDVDSANNTWSTARAGSGLDVDDADVVTVVDSTFESGTYYVIQAFFQWDTSSIGSDAVSSATMSLYDFGDAVDTDGGTLRARLKDWGTTVDTGDFVAGADLTSYTLLASSAVSNFGAGGAYVDFISEAAFAANINGSGQTKLFVSNSLQESASAPTGYNYAIVNAADTAGTTQDPKLTVVHAASGDTVAAGLALETDAAFAVNPTRGVTTGLAGETDSAFALDVLREFGVGLVLESDSAFALVPERTYDVGLALETDAAFTMTPERRSDVGQAAETNEAFPVVTPQFVNVGLAEETDEAQAITNARVVDIGLATEVDTATRIQPYFISGFRLIPWRWRRR